ncbi:MAG: SCP2 sterol-binding domain-containing protein [Roseiflexus sp.]|nr:SCP2 sterol-binding domain-containing protein [Roseiflexus sp.]MCS7288298.1 SCP2 sterol-binding domain-containing protein [Roseiflexus sp.]MDW8148910.1 SCP2 sterol-binding domain-containing protein [Roseiflexaceae bacterium]MDW8233442.1 SCP2 sterol-binding domain-containing protein [Roseiflexaceae bacterium]
MSDITPAVYFSQIVPQRFAEAVAGASEEILSQPELTVTYTIEGEGDQGGVFGYRISGSSIEFVDGGIEDADLQLVLSYDNWRSAAESDAPEPFIDYFMRRKVEVVKSLRGTVKLELTRPDESLFESVSIFGGQAEPSVTLRMTTDDYRQMLSGELNGQMAFMMGKLRFEGSLPLLMQIGALSG